MEVLLDDGQTLRDAVGNGAFAVIAPVGTLACEVRVLDVQGSVIERRDPAREFDAPPDAPQWKQRCGKR